ncbi:hypothetical protein WH95_11015, partial [Kiloniella litopenaei]
VAFQNLGVGENRDVSFSYDVSDGNGGIATENVVITVNGVGNVNQIHGDEDDNILTGTSDDEKIFGYGGDDILQGGGRNDELSGGKGNDVLIGEGSIYRYNLGDGYDRIKNREYDGKLIFGAGINLDSLRFRKLENHLSVDFEDSRAFVGHDKTLSTDVFNGGNRTLTTGLSDGGYIAVVASPRDSDALKQPFILQRYNTEGEELGTALNFGGSNTSDNEYSLLAITGTLDGGFIAVYGEEKGDGDRATILQHYTTNGDKVGDAVELEISIDALDDEVPFSITDFGVEGYGISWGEYDYGSGWKRLLSSQRYDLSGNILEPKITRDMADLPRGSGLVSIADGGYIVSWFDSKDTGWDKWDIVAQKYDRAGIKVGDEIKVRAGVIADDDDVEVVIKSLPNGGFIVGWVEYGNGSRDVYLQQLDANMKTVSGEVLFGSYERGEFHEEDLVSLSVFGLSDGGYIASLPITNYSDEKVDLRVFYAEDSSVDRNQVIIDNYYSGWSDDVVLEFADNSTIITGIDTATEDGTPIDGVLSGANARDDDNELSFSLNTGPAEGAVIVNTDGSYSFDPGTDFQDLRAGESRNVIFSYDSSYVHADGREDPVTKSVVITVTGTDDISTIRGDGESNHLVGTVHKDLIYGYAGNDTLTGGTGNDTLVGGEGNDTYLIGVNDGSDHIVNTQIGDGDDTVRFTDGVKHDQLWFKQDGVDLVIDVVGGNSVVTLDDWYSSPVDQIETSDGYILTKNNVDQLVSAMATFDAPALDAQSLTPEVEQGITPTITSSWQQ